jgi:DNA (cytosine-5)-methyltransferase 1
MIKILELFGGIGACSKSLEKLGIDYEIADYVEIDKYAVKSFNAMHNTNFEPQDICKWDKNIDVDLIMHGSPCQDFSLAGKQAGGDEGSGTRSSLMYETIRIVEKLKPKYVIWENVKNVISKKHKHNFENYLNKMEELGYKNHWQILNAKDYGIPQNRERVFTVSIRDDSGIKKSAFLGVFYYIDYDAINFDFPQKQELKLKLKDMLEDKVDEKYYLTSSMIEYLENGKYNSAKVSNKLKQTENGICPTLDTMQGGNRQPFIKINNGTKKCNDAMGVVLNRIDIKQKVKVRKYDVDINNLKKFLKQHKKYSNKEISKKLNVPITTVEHWFRNDKSFSIPDANIWYQLKEILSIKTNEFDESITTFIEKDNIYEKSNRCYFDNGVAPTLTSASSGEKIITDLRIRKLTPKECWRLMGFDDEDFEKAEKVNSNTQLYKQAGNSIVVNVLMAIIRNLLI